MTLGESTTPTIGVEKGGEADVGAVVEKGVYVEGRVDRAV